MEYRNSKGSLAQYLIDIKANVYECQGLDKETLQNLSFEDPFLEDAREILLKRHLYPKRSETSRGSSDGYDNLGIALKHRNGKYYLRGLLESKEVIEEAETKKVNSHPLTEAKKYITETYLLSGKFRNFNLDISLLEKAKKEGDVLYL